MISLPTLRRKIFRSFSLVVLLYAGLGVLLVFCVFLASNTTPKMLHVNYDSISAASEMREAWAALDRPERYPEHPAQFWTQKFEKALSFEERNITEPGEKETAENIRKYWDEYKNKSKHLPLSHFSELNSFLNALVNVNEKAMFGLTAQNVDLSKAVLWGSSTYFLISLILALLLADSLATRLSQPLKSLAEALQRRPGLGKKLKLANANSLELLILQNELKRLWDRVSESEQVNVKELVQQKNKLETVLESVEDGLLVIDANDHVSHCNGYLLGLLELNSEQVKNQLWRDIPTTHENYLKLRSLLRKEMPEAQEIELQTKNLKRQFSARQREIKGPGKSPIATLFLLHDITEKKQKDHFRAEFIDLLSHEIKTPLQSLGTASEFLTANQEELPEKLHPFVDIIADDVERIRAVANEFVQVTQSHSKIMKLKLEMASMDQSLREWMKPFKILAKDREVKLTLEKEGSPKICAQVDPVKFSWVISNLLSNAIRFSKAGEEVEVLLTDRNGFVEIQVKDHGPGIGEEDQQRMFEPFYQSSLSMSSDRRGLLGIGLTIVKEVVEAHDGMIEYYPRKPHGSEFRILLPFPEEDHG